MKILPVFLKHNVPNEFYVTNYDCNKLILEKLVCNDSNTFDIKKCILYVNDVAVNFIKGNWANKNVFYANGIPSNFFAKNIEPLSVVKFKLDLVCSKEEELKYQDTRFKLHLSFGINSLETSFSGINFISSPIQTSFI